MNDVIDPKSSRAYILQLEAERDRYKVALEEMTKPPTVFSTDDATDVASWFVDKAERVLREAIDG